MKKTLSLLFLFLIAGCTKTEVYFCPSFECEEKVISTLNSAESSVYFLAYSFTHQEIADVLIEKHNGGLDVRGIMEKQGINGIDSKYQKLIDYGVKVKTDKNKYLLHDKVFIIDGSIVITGSANPSQAGYLRNNENVVIIKDKEIAEKYLEEFNNLYK